VLSVLLCCSDVVLNPIDNMFLCVFYQGREGEAVLVKGARGIAPSNSYKISATYSSGYRLTAVCVVMGTKAAAKGRKTAEAILKRSVVNRLFYQRQNYRL